MPSTSHEHARRVAWDVLRTYLPLKALVAVELNLYPERGNAQYFRIPDLLVTLEAGELDPVMGRPRLSYRVWDEVGPPDLVMEFASTHTVGRDKVGKREDYAGFGIREYVQFDPLGTLLRPNLQVWRLAGDRYEAVPSWQGGGIPSAVLNGLEWVQLGDLVRLRNVATGALLPTATEAEAAGRHLALAQAEAAAARADAEATRADAEAARADAEATARQLMAAELAQLRADNAGLRRDRSSPEDTPPD